MTILSYICMILSIAFFFTPGMGTIDWCIEIFVIILALSFAVTSVSEKIESSWKVTKIIFYRYIGMVTVVFCIYPDIESKHTIPDFFVKNGGLLFKIWLGSIVLKWIVSAVMNYISSIKSKKIRSNIKHSSSSNGSYRRESRSYSNPSKYRVDNNYSYRTNQSSRKAPKEDKWDKEVKNLIKETERKIIIRKHMGLD